MWWYIFCVIPHIVFHYTYHRTSYIKSYISHAGFIQYSMIYRCFTVPVTMIYFKMNYFHTWNIITWVSPLYFFIPGIILSSYGAYLNYIIYKKLGIKGVYYDCEWNGYCTYVKDFPYNVLIHPMYIAACLCIIGSGLMLKFQLTLCLPYTYMIGCYLFSVYSESLPRKKLE